MLLGSVYMLEKPRQMDFANSTSFNQHAMPYPSLQESEHTAMLKGLISQKYTRQMTSDPQGTTSICTQSSLHIVT